MGDDLSFSVWPRLLLVVVVIWLAHVQVNMIAAIDQNAKTLS
jgi:hypothetical protein